MSIESFYIHTVVVSRKVEVEQLDGSRDVSTTTAVVASLPCRIVGVDQNEALTDSKRTDRYTHHVYCSPTAGASVQHGDIITYGSRVFHVQTVHNVHEAGKYLRIDVLEI